MPSSSRLCPPNPCRFALERIYNDVIFRNDDFIAPEKVRGIVVISGEGRAG
jgi:hypothetical protein